MFIRANHAKIWLTPLTFTEAIVSLWGEKDSNLRSLATTELQSVPFGHSGISPPFIAYTQEQGQ